MSANERIAFWADRAQRAAVRADAAREDTIQARQEAVLWEQVARMATMWLSSNILTATDVEKALRAHANDPDRDADVRQVYRVTADLIARSIATRNKPLREAMEWSTVTDAIIDSDSAEAEARREDAA